MMAWMFFKRYFAADALVRTSPSLNRSIHILCSLKAEQPDGRASTPQTSWARRVDFLRVCWAHIKHVMLFEDSGGTTPGHLFSAVVKKGLDLATS
jgi:hypothetical protein